MKYIQPESLPTPGGHYSPAIVHNGTVYVSGQIAVKDGKPISNNPAEQAKICLQNMETILVAASSDRNHVLKLNIYISDRSYWEDINAVCTEFFGEHKPARTIITSGDLHYFALVEIDCIAAQIH